MKNFCIALNFPLLAGKKSKAELFGFQPCLAYKIFALLDLFSGKDHSEHQYLYKTFQKLAVKNDLEMQKAVVL